MSRYRLLLLFCLGIWLAGCGADKEPQVLIYPSITPSPMPVVDTPTPTLTITPSPTMAQTATPTLTIPPPTLPPQGGNLEPTSPLRPTFTPAPATHTATFQSFSSSQLEILYFATNEDSVIPGDRVTLYWRINGADTARIYRLDAGGERSYFWDVSPEGRQTVATDAEITDTAQFILVGQRGEEVVEKPLAIPVSSQCPFFWFFSPAPPDCPTGDAVAMVMVEQQFENGFMIWTAADRQIYVMFADDREPAWLQLDDTFTDDMPAQDDSLQPPDGRLQPVRGFGLVWRSSADIQERLGWAVTAEVGYDGVIQQLNSPERDLRFIRRQTQGEIVQLLGDGSAWEPLTVTAGVSPASTATPTLPADQ